VAVNERVREIREAHIYASGYVDVILATRRPCP
jgi:hypothetical protein